MASPLLSRDPLTGPVSQDEGLLTGPADADEDALIADPGFMDYVKDIMGSTARGLEENVSSYPGIGGDIGELIRSTLVLDEKYLGNNDPAKIDQIRTQPNPLPTTEDIHSAVTSNPYEPKTAPGKVAKEVASLVSPRGILRGAEHLARDVVFPYLGGKAGETIGEQLGPEEAQVLSAVGGSGGSPGIEGAKRVAVRTMRGGPLAPEAATTMRTLQNTNVPLTPEGPDARAERVRRLQAEGVDVSAGQALGSEAVKRLEAGPFNKGGAFNEQQNRQFTRAALQRVGINADIASPEVMNAAQQQFGQMYDDLIRQNNGLTLDPTFHNALTDTAINTERLLRTPNNLVTDYYNSIAEAGRTGAIPPDVYQQIHSELSADIQAIQGDPARTVELRALRQVQDALYDTIGRNGQPEIQAHAQELNNRYRNFKIVEDAVGGAGEGVSFGLVSPGKLRAALEARDPTAYRQGRGDFAELARTGQSITALPMTGTGAQNITSSLPGLGHAAMVAPFSSLIRSRPVRTSIVNRATGVNPDWLDPMQMPPILNQAAGAGEPPVVVEPEEPEKQSFNFEAPGPVERSGDLPQLVLDMMRRRGLA